MDKTLVINGPQGSGKTLLAKYLAAREGSFCTTTVGGALMANWPDRNAKTVIVEEVDGTDVGEMNTLKMLVTSEHLSPSRPNFPSRKTPNFIFVTQAHKPLKLGADERRFMVRDLTEILTPEQARELIDHQRKECSSGGDRQYISLIHPIKFCDFYNRRAMSCTAKAGSCGRQCQRVKP